MCNFIYIERVKIDNSSLAIDALNISGFIDEALARELWGPSHEDRVTGWQANAFDSQRLDSYDGVDLGIEILNMEKPETVRPVELKIDNQNAPPPAYETENKINHKRKE